MILTADCETDPFSPGRIPKPFIWGLYDGNKFLSFSSTESFAKYISDLDCIIYIHNGGKFDFHYLIDYLNLNSSISYINGRIAKARLGKSVLKDSYCILPFPLDSYNKTKIDYKKFEENVRHKYIDEIESYLKDDCIFLFELVQQFIQLYGNKLTIASSAINEYKQMGHTIFKSNIKYYNTFYPFYFGGRVQCFQSGHISGDITYADINSAYPNAMLQEHPIDTKYYILNKWKGYNQDFIEAEISSPYGALLKRTPKGLALWVNKKPEVIFTTGWELNTALKLNLVNIHKIIRVYHFPFIDCFSKYVNRFFKIKKEAKESGDKKQELFAKLFLNSLYGKFAQNPSKYTINKIIDDSKLPHYTHKLNYSKYYPIGSQDRLMVSKPSNNGYYYNLATSASITGCVRAFLLESLHNVDEPLYCDTDSIFFKGNHSLDIGNNIGQWKIEGKTTDLFIGGKKLYSTIMSDGITKSAAKGTSLSHTDIKNIAKGDYIIQNPEVPIFSLKKGIYFQQKKTQKTC